MSTNGVKPTTLILTLVAAVALTVAVLEYHGVIRHSLNKDAVPVGDFKAMYLAPGESFRLSPNEPEVRAECHRGYLVIASKTDEQMRGLLVDFKNRGVSCTLSPDGVAEPVQESGNSSS